MAEYKSIYTGEEIDAAIGKANTSLQVETDPIFSASASAGITSQDIQNWNNKSEFSGSYNDLTNKPTIPDVSNFITKDVNNLTYYELATQTGNSIVMSLDNSTYVLTVSLKNSAGTILNTQTVDLPLETMVINGSYDSVNKKIILTLKNGTTIEFSVADLVSGLQSEITSSNKLSSDLVDDTNNTNKFVSASDKTNWNGKAETSELLTNVQSSPVIFEDMSKGMYDMFNLSFPWYYKIKNTSTTENITINSARALNLCVIDTIENIEKEYEEYPALTYEKVFAYLYYMKTNSGDYLSTALILKRDGTLKMTNVSRNIQWITNSAQTFSGIKTFNNIPQLNSNVTPTSDSQLTNKKYVDDLVASLGGGAVVNMYTSDYSNLVNMNSLKKGIYYPLGNFGNVFYYQIDENGSRQTLSTSNVSQFKELIILKEQSEVTSGETIGYLLYVAKDGIEYVRELHYIVNTGGQITGMTSGSALQTNRIYLPLTNFDGTKTQILKNVNGTIQWVDET